MKRLRHAPLLAALLPALIAAPAAAADAAVPPRVAAAAAKLVKAGIAPALVVAVVDDGRTAIVGYGKLYDGRAPDARTVFEIGSATKTFTALLLAQQIQQGKATLDTPLSAWLPGWKIPSRDGKPITLGLLAGQYSGLPRLPANLAATSMVDPYAHYAAKQLKAFLASYALPRDPGAKYEYSNLGFGLLGYALATHAGLGYGELLQREVLQPLGMASTAAALTPALRARLATGHGVDGQPAGHWQWRDALAGAGAVISDGHDMLAYLEANMGIAKTPLAAAMALARQPRRAFPMGKVGLAWMTSPTPGGDVVWHNGATGGYSSFIGFTADRRHGVVLLANSLAAGDKLTELGMAALSPALPLPTVRAEVHLPAAVLAGYVGHYTLAPGVVFDIALRQGQLCAQLTGQPAVPVHASAKDRFYYTVVDATLDFQRDAGGKVVALVLHQHGKSMRAPRQP